MKIAMGVPAAALALLLSACASVPGPLNGLGRDPLTKIVLTHSSGRMTTQQYLIAQAAAELNNQQIEFQLSDPLESVGVSGGAYGVGYAIAGALGIQGFRGVDAGAYALQSGTIGLAGGAVNGLHSNSYASVSVTGSSTEATLRDWEKGAAIPPALTTRFPNLRDLVLGLHAWPAYVRSRNRTNSPAEGLVPDWSGQPAPAR